MDFLTANVEVTYPTDIMHTCMLSYATEVAAGAGQVVLLTLGVVLKFFGRYWMDSGHPLPSPTGCSGMNKPSAMLPLVLKV